MSASLAVLAGCTTSPSPTPPTAPVPGGGACTFSIAITQATFDAVGGTGSGTVTTDPACRWTVSAGGQPWIRIDAPRTFVGSATIPLAIEPNRSFTGRSGVVEIHDDRGAARAVQEVAQRAAGCLYSIEPTTVSRDWLGTSDGSDVGILPVRVHAEPSECRWTATATVPWLFFLHYNPSTGTGDATINVSIGWNSNPATRTGELVIAGLSGVNPDARLVVTQTGR